MNDIFTVEIKYSPGEIWKNFTLFIGYSRILTIFLTFKNEHVVKHKIVVNKIIKR